MTVKESMEVLDALEALAKFIVEAEADDGDITWKDIPKAIPLFLKAKAAVQGVDGIKSEVIGMTHEEVQAVLSRCWDILLEYLKIAGVG